MAAEGSTGRLARTTVSVAAVAALGTLLAISWAKQSRLEAALGEARRLARTGHDLARDPHVPPPTKAPAEAGGDTAAADAPAATEPVTAGGFVDFANEPAALARRLDEQTAELYRRHQRIVELQEEVERLTRERIESADRAAGREDGVRREYEAALRNERARRRALEKNLTELDDIRRLRDKLKVLVEEMERLATARAEKGPSTSGAR